MSLKDLLQNLTKTTNGAGAYKTTTNYVVDLFGKAGAVRNLEVEDVKELVRNAMKENCEQTLKLVFYFGDIREGMGERRFFQIAINLLAIEYTELMKLNLHLIPYYNRWDSIYSLIDTPLEADVFNMASKQFKEDLECEKPSLLAKWMFTTNDTSELSRALAFRTYKYFGFKSTIKYNQAVRKNRKKLNLIETKLCNKDYENIRMEEIPTKAQKVYSDALIKHIPEKVSEYYSKLSKGEIVRETKTLFPYEIVRIADATQKDALWKSLPNMFEENHENILPIIDTSGSMWGVISKNSSVTCLDVAIGLGIYLAERNNGYFKDFWVNFSDNPNFYTLKGETLSEKINSLDYKNWMTTTNLVAVFDLLLDTAKRNGVSKEEMPTKIFIVSDMQFNCIKDYSSTVFDYIDDSYKKAGYTRPTLVFWQVNGTLDNVPITIDSHNTMLVSGFSQNLLPYVLGDSSKWSPMIPVLNIVEDERYSLVITNIN